MERINGAVCWYQKKISTYDKQLWERSVEQTVLKNISNVPKKPANVKSELIDVDLVRGSTFSKAKPVHSAFAVARKGLIRVIFMPLFYNYWIKQTSKWTCGLLFTLYVMQVATMSVYVTDTNGSLDKETLSLAHLLSPLALMLALGLIHSQMVATQVSSKHRQERHQKKREAKECRKTILKQYEKGTKNSSSDHGVRPVHETGSTATVRSRKTKTYYRRKTSASPSDPSGRTNKKTALRVNDYHEADDEEEEIRSHGNRPRETHSRTINQCDKTVGNGACGTVTRADRHYEYISNAQGESDVHAHSMETPYSLSQPLSDATGELQASSPYDQEGMTLMEDEYQGNVEYSGELLPAMDDGFPAGHPPPARREAGADDQHSDSGLNSIGEDGDISHPAVAPPRGPNPPPENNKSSPPVSNGHTHQASADAFSAVPHDEVLVNNSTVVIADIDIVKAGDSTPEKQNKQKILSFLEERTKNKLDKNSASESSSCESEVEVSTAHPSPKHGTSEADWDDTMNTEMTSCSGSDISCSSETDISAKEESGEGSKEEHVSLGIHGVNSVMNNLASSTDKVSCMIFENEQVQKADLTVIDIGWCIIRRVEQIPETCDYLVMGIVFSFLLMLSPVLFRWYHAKDQIMQLDMTNISDVDVLLRTGVGENWRQVVLIVNGCVQRFCMSLLFFFLLSVAERTFKLRLLYAKHFCYLTSFRRAKKYELPHFRLNKVRNIKTWLSLRSYLKKRGPQRSVDIIVSAAFIMAIFLVSVMCFELLQDFGRFLDHLGNLELVIWCMALSIYLLRFMTLGTKINKKYRNFSVLITEQINLYLHMEQKPHKKDELMLANSVLKLAEDLLKELESPFKISGLSANPFLYNITKVVVLSAFSAVLTELLGFKLKLYKIKLRA